MKNASFTRRAFRHDKTIVHAGRFLRKGQPHTTAAVGTFGMRPLKYLKNTFVVLRIEANPVVGYGQVVVWRTGLCMHIFYVIASYVLAAYLHPGRRAWLMKFQCIVEKLPQ